MYQVRLAAAVVAALSTFHPDIRKMLKAGVKELGANPYAGKELLDELAGFRSYRVKRYRIVYTTDAENRLIKVYMIGHRREIYDVLVSLIAPQKD